MLREERRFDVADKRQRGSGEASDPSSEIIGPETPSIAISHRHGEETQFQRIAQVLHDDVLQAFATCLLKAQLCERLVQLERYDQVNKELISLQDSLNETIDQVRALTMTLKQLPE